MNALLCEKESITKKKEINLYFSQEQGDFETIQIDNSYNGILQKAGERFLTTKADREKHGFGLKSVEETAAKYGGVVLMDAKEKSFSTLLTLSKKYYKE